MAKVTVNIDRAALQKFMYQDGGQVQRYLDEKARQLEAAARRNIETRAKGGTGDLAGSLRTHKTFGNVPGFTNSSIGRVVATSSPQGEFTEVGTGPGHESPNGDPSPNAPYWPAASDSLIAWGIRNIPEVVRYDRSGNPNIFLLQRHIHDYGTPAYHWMLDALKEVFPQVHGSFGS